MTSKLFIIFMAGIITLTFIEQVFANDKGVVIEELGRSYLAYPDTTGTVSFNNCWLSGREPLIEKWMSEFNRYYPGIKVINDNQQVCSELMQYQKALIGGGAPPSVLMVQSQNFRFYKEIEALRPLNDLIERDQIDSSWFYRPEWEARQVDGQIYGLPNVTAGAQFLMIYKKKYLLEAGLQTIETWQDLEILAKVARANNIFILDPGRVFPSQVTFFQCLLYSNGGKLWNDAFTKITWNSPAGLEAAQWLLNFANTQADDYYTLRIPGNHRGLELLKFWAAGPYITIIDGSWSFYLLEEIAPDLDFIVAPFPRNANNVRSKGNTPVEGGWSFGIANNISPRDEAAAWEWIKFTTLSRYACEFTVSQSRPSPMQDCNEDRRLHKQNPHWDAVKKALTQAEAVPTFAINIHLHELLIHMQDAILNELMSPANALKVYSTKAQTLLDEWNQMVNE